MPLHVFLFKWFCGLLPPARGCSRPVRQPVSNFKQNPLAAEKPDINLCRRLSLCSSKCLSCIAGTSAQKTNTCLAYYDCQLGCRTCTRIRAFSVDRKRMFSSKQNSLDSNLTEIFAVAVLFGSKMKTFSRIAKFHAWSVNPAKFLMISTIPNFIQQAMLGRVLSISKLKPQKPPAMPSWKPVSAFCIGNPHLRQGLTLRCGPY